MRAIIHLAALQVPFCKADPVAGARANVVGTVNVLEAARSSWPEAGRLRQLDRGALSFFPDAPWLDTLYGAYKLCNEMTASVYFQDWGVPSVGIRPGVVYGVARDQGLTSKTTIAILAAAAGKPYTIPFTGAVSALHAGEIASAFIKAVSRERNEARVFDLNGRATSVPEWLEILRGIAPAAQLSMTGAELPFPADLSDAAIQVLPRRLRPGPARPRHPRHLRRLQAAPRQGHPDRRSGGLSCHYGRSITWTASARESPVGATTEVDQSKRRIARSRRMHAFLQELPDVLGKKPVFGVFAVIE